MKKMLNRKSLLTYKYHAVIFFALLAFNSIPTYADTWQPSPGHTQIPLWPDEVPDSLPSSKPETVMEVTDHLIAGKSWFWIENVLQPTMTVYSPKENNTGAAIIVFPGGGYQGLAIDLEGTEVCDWLMSKGITCVVLKYRVPGSAHHWDQNCQCAVNPKVYTALQDAQRAMSLIRFRASEWNIDPKKVGVLGFSAGGHLVALTSTNSKRVYKPIDAADKEKLLPDFAVALYPGHLWNEKKFELRTDTQVHVTSETSPTFLLHAEDDPVDDVSHSLVYYVALKKAKVPVEMHLFAEGGHAFGLRRTKFSITGWPQLAEKWLRTQGVIAK